MNYLSLPFSLSLSLPFSMNYLARTFSTLELSSYQQKKKFSLMSKWTHLGKYRPQICKRGWKYFTMNKYVIHSTNSKSHWTGKEGKGWKNQLISEMENSEKDREQRKIEKTVVKNARKQRKNYQSNKLIPEGMIKQKKSVALRVTEKGNLK